MCELVADTRQRIEAGHRWIQFRKARGEEHRVVALLNTCASLGRTLDIAGTHLAGDLL
jgi:hypothetical protein